MEIAGYAAAILIGLSLGLIGGGGSILTVPILVYFFRIEPVMATTYSLFVVGLTSPAGAVSHYSKGNVNFQIAFLFGMPSLIAVFIMRKWVMPAMPHYLLNIGAFELTKPVLLMLVFAVLMLAASISMIRKKKEVPVFDSQLNYSKLIIQSIAVGTITGFVGVGGGFLIIPSLVLFAGLPIKKAVGTSLMVMTISSLLGVLGDVSRHSPINYSFLIVFSAFAIAGIIAGSYLTKYITDTKLKPAFGWFILLMGIFVLITTLINDIELIKEPWPWYVAGPLIGLIVPALLLLGNKTFGISGTLRQVCAACFPSNIPFFKYDWKKESWNLFFAAGIIIGGFVATFLLSNPGHVNINPHTTVLLQQEGVKDFSGLLPKDIFSFSQFFTLRGFVFIIVGGFLVGFGTRYAGGCTSGHSIMGIASLQWPSLVATCCFMIGGFVMTWFILPYLLKL